jgi:hypothetical protein
MKKILLAAGFVAAMACAAYAVVLDPPISTFTINGHTYTNADWEANFQGTLSAVASDIAAVIGAVNGLSAPTNADLKLLDFGGGTYVLRQGFAASGDGGAMWYKWSSSNCTTPDNGAQVQPTATTGCWLADFGDAEPNPMVWGARGDGVTDDTAALQAYINAMQYVTIAPGTYCIKTGPLVSTRDGQTIRGRSRQDTSRLSACGADVSIINMSGYRSVIDELHVRGSQNPLTTKHTINLLGGQTYPHCAECEITNSFIDGGHYAIYADAYEIYLKWSRVEFSYGAALVYLTNTGGYIFRGKFDQYYPRQNPAFGIAPPAPWIANHAYTYGDLVQITTSGKNFLLQAMTSGTTGGVQPNVAPYHTDIPDGAVTWRLSSPDGYSGIWFDTNSGYDAFVSYSDFSSNFTTGIQITNTLGGDAPHFIYLDHLTMGSNLRELIYIDAGFGVNIVDSHFGNCMVNPCTIISVQGGFQGDLIVSRNWLGGTGSGGPASGGTGLYLGGGHRSIISENIFTTGTTAISVESGVQNFIINNNEFASGVFGCSLNGIYIEPGASNYYSIMGNNLSCVTNPLSDGGTGTEKQILNISTPTTLRNLPTSCTGQPAGTMRNNGGVVNICP